MTEKSSGKRTRAVPGQTKESNFNVVVVGAIVVGMLGLAVLLYFALREPPPIEGIISVARPARGHDDEAVFAETGLPPAGGVHFNQWQNCGIYTEPVETGNVLHSLEHGAVWITYQPELPAEQVETLQEYVRGRDYMLISPFPGLRSPIVLTAWGYQLELQSPDDDRIEDFIGRYVNGPQTPERLGSCTDGVGSPES